MVRRARPGETLTTLDDVERDARPRGPADHRRRRRSPRPSPASWAAPRSEVSPTHDRRAGRGRALRPDHRGAHRPGGTSCSTEASKRFERGVDPALAAGRRPARRRPARRARRRHRRPGRDRRRPRRPARDACDARRCPADPAGRRRLPTRAEVVEILRAIGCAVDESTATADACRGDVRRPGARTSSHGADFAEEVARLRRLRPDPVDRAAAPPAGRGLTHGQRVRAGSSRTRSPTPGFVEVLTYPFVGDGVTDAPRAARPTTSGGTRSGWPTRCPTRRR